MKTRNISRRSIALDWDDETIWNHTLIERRAQKMRAEAAWAMAVAIREWAVSLFRQGKAKARVVAQSSLERHGQAT